ncbi:MAG: hypothetical protein HQM03_16925 [Magnetococcales bacterium]|nr:hypothetical protein [Magnetococcales bacterium]
MLKNQDIVICLLDPGTYRVYWHAINGTQWSPGGCHGAMIVMIVCVDDEKPETRTELWQRPLPQVDLEKLKADKYLDEMEDIVADVGKEMER